MQISMWCAAYTCHGRCTPRDILLLAQQTRIHIDFSICLGQVMALLREEIGLAPAGPADRVVVPVVAAAVEVNVAAAEVNAAAAEVRAVAVVVTAAFLICSKIDPAVPHLRHQNQWRSAQPQPGDLGALCHVSTIRVADFATA